MRKPKLYHYQPNANSMKPLLCLAEKGIPYQSHRIDLHNFEQHSEAFVALNPNGQVPVLIHDRAVITESTVINEYLDEVFLKKRLVPKDPVARARMRIWNKFVDEYFCPALSRIGWSIIIPQIAARPVKRVVNTARDEVECRSAFHLDVRTVPEPGWRPLSWLAALKAGRRRYESCGD